MPEVVSGLRPKFLDRVPPLAAVAVFAAFVALFLWDRPAYEALLRAVGVHWVHAGGDMTGGRPFIDTRFVLAQLECWRRGIDVYSVNPCDPLGRLQDYSPLWLRLDFIPASSACAVPFGLALDVLFLAALFALPLPRFRVIDHAVLSLTMVSTASIFALERGNTDLLIFAMCVIAARLLLRSLPWRVAGYGVILAAAALKFYPLVLLVVALRERVRTLLAIAVVSAGAAGAFAWRFGAETQRALGNATVFYFEKMWGAANLPFGGAHLAVVLLPGVMARHPGLREALGRAIPLSVLAGLVILAAAVAIRLAMQRDFARAFAALPEPMRLFLTIGAALTAGCFFAHPNIEYRAVVLLLEAPGLLALARGAAPGRVRGLLWANAVATVFLVWDAPAFLPSVAPAGWLLRQYVWWAHVTVSMAALVRLGLDSAAWQWLRGAVQPARVAA